MRYFAIYLGSNKLVNLVTPVMADPQEQTNPRGLVQGSRFIELESCETVQPMNQVKPTTLKNNKISSRIQRKLDRRMWANFN